MTNCAQIRPTGVAACASFRPVVSVRSLKGVPTGRAATSNIVTRSTLVVDAPAVSEPVVKEPAVAAPTVVLSPHEVALARVRYMLEVEAKQLAVRPQVKISFQKKVGLGEYWKVVGGAPELGSWTPEVAPSMFWNNGDNWVFQGPIKPGKYTFKIVLRNAEGAYLYETGPDRTLEIPASKGPQDVIELQLNNVSLPQFG